VKGESEGGYMEGEHRECEEDSMEGEREGRSARRDCKEGELGGRCEEGERGVRA
jgi:hypothetical protein